MQCVNSHGVAQGRSEEGVFEWGVVPCGEGGAREARGVYADLDFPFECGRVEEDDIALKDDLLEIAAHGHIDVMEDDHVALASRSCRVHRTELPLCGVF